MASLATRMGKSRDAAEMSKVAAGLTTAINRHGWDGRWYLYAIDDQGRPVGGSQCAEGKIHLNVNAWAIFTGIAGKAGREDVVWDSLKTLGTPLGHLLLAPSYTAASRDEVGRIADIMPGMFENGSIYLHGEAFFLYALATQGRAEECLAGLLRILPSSMVQDVATGPRHQQSNFTVGPDHPAFGAQLFSNFTGSLSWFRRVVTELLGVKPGFDALEISCSAPPSWRAYEVKKVWRGKRVHVRFATSGTPGNASIRFKGKSYAGEIPFRDLDAAGTNRIDVTF
jgi:cellobiose phosphorylase